MFHHYMPICALIPSDQLIASPQTSGALRVVLPARPIDTRTDFERVNRLSLGVAFLDKKKPMLWLWLWLWLWRSSGTGYMKH